MKTGKVDVISARDRPRKRLSSHLRIEDYMRRFDMTQPIKRFGNVCDVISQLIERSVPSNPAVSVRHRSTP
jgi:hypothetical protein